MNRETLRRLCRSYVDEFGGQWLQTIVNGDPTQAFTVDDYLNLGMDDYADETMAFPNEYSRLNIANQSIWSKAAFGVEAASLVRVGVLQAAVAGAMPLVAGEPVNTYMFGHRISITVKNNTGAPAVGAADTYTITGTTRGGVPAVEEISFTVLELTLGDQAVRTKIGTTLFTTVTDISAGAGQVAGWQHSAGVGAQAAGTRILGITRIDFAGSELHELTKSRLEADYSGWAYAAAATPRHWWRDGNFFRIYPVSADAAAVIKLYCYEQPDNSLWADSTAEPPSDAQDHELLAVKAAHRIITRNPTEANMARASGLLPIWQKGIEDAVQRIHGANGADVIVGLRAQLRSSSTIERVT